MRPSAECRAIRKKLRLTQAQMALELGLSRTGYSILERGQAKRLHAMAARTLLRERGPALVEEQLADLYEPGQPDWWTIAQRLYVREGKTYKDIYEQLGYSMESVGRAVSLTYRMRARSMEKFNNRRRADRHRQQMEADPAFAEQVRAKNRARNKAYREARKARPAGLTRQVTAMPAPPPLPAPKPKSTPLVRYAGAVPRR